jgi:hypothetical protein
MDFGAWVLACAVVGVAALLAWLSLRGEWPD